MGKLFVVIVIALLVLTGCLGRSGDSSIMQYDGPAEQTVSMGETIAGTDVRYTGYSARGAEVSVGGQPALKKAGDSLDWKGTPVKGVDVVLAQRIILINEQRLQTIGTVKVTVHDMAVSPAQFPDKPLYSYKVAVTYTVTRGAAIPGTQITFAGKAQEGAQLGGVTGYPYRKLGDSIAWMGRLRDNVYIDLTVRVIAYTDDVMQVGGLATIGLVE